MSLHEIAGSPLASTAIVKLQVDVSPNASVAVYVTRVDQIGKTEPDAKSGVRTDAAKIQ